MLGYFVALAVVVWIAQTVLGFRQFKKFNAHLKELRKEGRTVFAGFRPFENFNGLTLFELSDDLCKSMKLPIQQATAVMSAQKEYEAYKLMKAEESLMVN